MTVLSLFQPLIPVWPCLCAVLCGARVLFHLHLVGPPGASSSGLPVGPEACAAPLALSRCTAAGEDESLDQKGPSVFFFFFWSFSLEAFLKMMDIHCGKEATLSKWRQVGPIRSPFTHLAPHRGLGDPRTLGCGETSPMILEPLSGM